ncbi:MAG: hypothetical protein A2784_03780 [Candidatus Chisholmbacteria bacterium RIFCSPHIGHO2_01_FULL_48_12]|uniref:Uncharacterized protein n=1 Tax=Candidatus Chisholmbacteria bacterium RIFCSPHIGHO2_01_FULL_48_12 TaxID=1797589 RepID=A0A1G1VMJ2_9BACT|nr:MAG: hypothetical protein A2784_03780 [Candidatus Chisholmbacteria bacterium RIFCSPHIGHO2_01_FULL_48_12]
MLQYTTMFNLSGFIIYLLSFGLALIMIRAFSSAILVVTKEDKRKKEIKEISFYLIIALLILNTVFYLTVNIIRDIQDVNYYNLVLLPFIVVFGFLAYGYGKNKKISKSVKFGSLIYGSYSLFINLSTWFSTNMSIDFIVPSLIVIFISIFLGAILGGIGGIINHLISRVIPSTSLPL